MKESINKVLKKKYIPTEEFYSQVIDSLQDYSVFTLNNNMEINSWNSGAANIFQYSIDEIIGKPYSIIFSEEDIRNGIPAQEVRIAMEKGRATDNRWHICKDKSKIFAHGLVFPLYSEDGEHVGFVKILRDITSQKKAELAIKRSLKELEELNTHKDNVLAILSHDLRSPLASIIGATDYLKNNYDEMDEEERKEIIEQLYKSSENQLTMLDYLLEWARVKYASEAFSPTTIHLKPFVEDIIELMHEQATSKLIDINSEIENDISVYADKKMLLSIFQNLITNAIKYTPEGGEINIKAKFKEDEDDDENKSMVEVEIADNGIGISEENIKKLFTPQMITLSKPRKKHKGAGIGLLLVKGFLEKNNGSIRVESEEGKGTSFFFSLHSEKPKKKE